MKQADDLIAQTQLMGLSVSPLQAEQLLLYLGLMSKWNKVHNLTALRDPDQMISHHLLDSLSVIPYVSPGSLLDVGSGAGLPGIPLALVNPGQAITLIDSNQKKVSFLRQAVIELNLKNVTVAAGRVEELQTDLRFNGIISRAFSDINQFINKTRHLLAKKGNWYAMKGLYPDFELQQLPAGVVVQTAQPLIVPLLNAQRHLLIMKEADG